MLFTTIPVDICIVRNLDLWLCCEHLQSVQANQFIRHNAIVGATVVVIQIIDHQKAFIVDHAIYIDCKQVSIEIPVDLASIHKKTNRSTSAQMKQNNHIRPYNLLRAIVQCTIKAHKMFIALQDHWFVFVFKIIEAVLGYIKWLDWTRHVATGYGKKNKLKWSSRSDEQNTKYNSHTLCFQIIAMTEVDFFGAICFRFKAKAFSCVNANAFIALHATRPRRPRRPNTRTRTRMLVSRLFEKKKENKIYYLACSLSILAHIHWQNSLLSPCNCQYKLMHLDRVALD